MTIKDVILSFPGIDGVSSSFMDVVLIDRNINSSANYDDTHKKSVRLAVADIYSNIGGLPDFTEFKLSIKYPRAWYIQKAKDLYIANGEPEKANSMSGIKVPRGKSPQSW